jgi:Alpha-glutamyl/putrescinyl thymine pyrophosphorylase clade 3
VDRAKRKFGAFVRPKDRNLAQQLDRALRAFDQNEKRLVGIRSIPNRRTFLEQVLESVRRIKYISLIRSRDISLLRLNPSSELFDPLRGAALCQRRRHIDEAFWLIFLSVHFGKNRRTGWRLARDIYGGLGGTRWDWATVSAHPDAFRAWLGLNQGTLLGGDGISRHFGNHRKYQSLDASSPSGTGVAIESYVRWVAPPRTHPMVIQDMKANVGTNPRAIFSGLYDSMKDVVSFGRTAKFDYLTMVGKMQLAPIEPGSTYMQGATGPLAGARLLFGDNTGTAKALDLWLVKLDAYLGLPFGMQVLEDALCNWQKSPGKFKPFRG